MELLTPLQQRNYKAMMYLAKVNPERYVLEYKDKQLTLTEYAEVGSSVIWKFPFKTFTLETK